MLEALEGNRSAAAEFFRAFLDGPLYIPERVQAQPMSDQPEYPNDFFYLLGLRAEDRTIIPAFSRPDLVSEWCGSSLRQKTMSGKELLGVVPEDWWVTVNPGLDVEKELSPWELDRLREGEPAFPELIAELFPLEARPTLSLEPVPEEEYRELVDVLRKEAENHSQINNLYLAREAVEENESDALPPILLGVEATCKSADQQKSIEDALQRAGSVTQIGAEPLRIRIGASLEGNLLLGAFTGIEPFYRRPSRGSVIENVKRFFAK